MRQHREGLMTTRTGIQNNMNRALRQRKQETDDNINRQYHYVSLKTTCTGRLLPSISVETLYLKTFQSLQNMRTSLMATFRQHDQGLVSVLTTCLGIKCLLTTYTGQNDLSDNIYRAQKQFMNTFNIRQQQQGCLTSWIFRQHVYLARCRQQIKL